MTTTELAERLKKFYPRDSKVVFYIKDAPFEVDAVIGHPKKNYAVLTASPLKEDEETREYNDINILILNAKAFKCFDGDAEVHNFDVIEENNDDLGEENC